MIPNDVCRCLARNCDRANECARHLAIRQSTPPSDHTPVSERLCDEGDFFIGASEA